MREIVGIYARCFPAIVLDRTELSHARQAPIAGTTKTSGVDTGNKGFGVAIGGWVRRVVAIADSTVIVSMSYIGIGCRVSAIPIEFMISIVKATVVGFYFPG